MRVATRIGAGVLAACVLVLAALGLAAPAGATTDCQLDYVQGTSNVPITGTTSAAQTPVLTGNSVTYDGTTKIRLEFYTSEVLTGSTTTGFIAVNLFEGSTELGLLGDVGANDSSSQTIDTPVNAVRYFTPTAGAHTYSVKAYRGNANGTVVGGDGTGNNGAPMFLRIQYAECPAVAGPAGAAGATGPAGPTGATGPIASTLTIAGPVAIKGDPTTGSEPVHYDGIAGAGGSAQTMSCAAGDGTSGAPCEAAVALNVGDAARLDLVWLGVFLVGGVFFGYFAIGAAVAGEWQGWGAGV